MKNRIAVPAQAGIEPSKTGFRVRSGMTAVFSSDLAPQRHRGDPGRGDQWPARESEYGKPLQEFGFAQYYKGLELARKLRSICASAGSKAEAFPK